MEAAMHVPGYTMASCQASYGFLKIASAPDLKDYNNGIDSRPESLRFLSSVESKLPSSERSETPVLKARISTFTQEGTDDPAGESPQRSLAACLAMPMEAIEYEANDDIESLAGKESRRSECQVLSTARSVSD
jgi:hypothetical protein